MSVLEVKAYLEQFNRAQDVLEFAVSSATVALAAEALQVEEARIAKTLSFYQGEGCILVVTAGDAKIDNSKFKAQFGQKAKMLSPEDVLAFTGHAVGGVCPFALPPDNVTVYCDESMRRFDTIFPACGSSNSAIALTCDELYHYANAQKWVDVCKLPE